MRYTKTISKKIMPDEYFRKNNFKSTTKPPKQYKVCPACNGWGDRGFWIFRSKCRKCNGIGWIDVK